jgi:hypothetical protein
MQQLLRETKAILNSLATFNHNPPSPISAHIASSDFQALYKIMDEQTSSSPSGRHIGHYKAAVKHDHLANLHSMMMSIPMQAGFSPERWRQIIDVMLEKKQGDHIVHRLRIIALQESDFNQCNGLLIGRPVLHNLEDHQVLPDMQNGSRPSKMCHSAVLKKQLTFDIHRYKKQTIAYIENDAVGFYDRIANPLILIFLQILGLSPSVMVSLAKTWEHTYHRIKTIWDFSGAIHKPDSHAAIWPRSRIHHRTPTMVALLFPNLPLPR